MLSFTLTTITIIGLALASDSILSFGIIIGTIIGFAVAATHSVSLMTAVK